MIELNTTPFIKSNTWWNAYYISLGLIVLCISLYCLSDGNWDYKRQYFFGDVFWDMWLRLNNGDFTADRHIIFDEAMVIQGKTYAYFLPFPALIRGIQSILNLGPYPIPSILLAITLFIFSSVKIYLNLISFVKLKTKEAVALAAYTGGLLIVGSPILVMLSFPLMFWEAIIWGAAIFMTCCMLSCKVLEGPQNTRNLYFFSLFCGLALFTRPTIFVASLVIFAITIFMLTRKVVLNSEVKNYRLKEINWSISLFLIFFLGIFLYNYLKWGSPFEFGNLKNYTLIWTHDYYQEFIKYGHFQFDRIPEGFAFYFLPTADNFTNLFPFLRAGGDNFFQGYAKQINYREAPFSIFISLPAYEMGFFLGLAAAIFGLASKNALYKKIFSVTLPIAVSSLIPFFIILGWFAHSVRYIGDLIPGLFFFSISTLLLFIIVFDNITSRIQSPIKLFLISSVCLTIATVLTLYCALSSSWVQRQAPLLRALAYKIRLPPTAINEVIDFNSTGNGTQYLKGNISNNPNNFSGWATPESWGVWSNGIIATIEFPVPIFPLNQHHIILQINARAFINKVNPHQNVSIYVNDMFIKNISLTKGDKNEIEILMPKPNPEDPKTQLRYLVVFKFQNANSPASIGAGDDNRLIAIGLEQAVFKER